MSYRLSPYHAAGIAELVLGNVLRFPADFFGMKFPLFFLLYTHLTEPPLLHQIEAGLKP